jgi:hypothetical protein
VELSTVVDQVPRRLRVEGGQFEVLEGEDGQAPAAHGRAG